MTPMPQGLADRSGAGAVRVAQEYLRTCAGAAAQMGRLAAAMDNPAGGYASQAATAARGDVPFEVAVALSGPGLPRALVRADGVYGMGLPGIPSWTLLTEEQIAALPETQGQRIELYGHPPYWVGLP